MSKAPQLLSGITILYAEDSAVINMMTTQQLQVLGAEVIDTEDGLSALEKARSMNFDIVVSDYYMPHLNGDELFHALRKQLEFKGLMVGVSATTAGSEAQKMLAAGANAILTKPLEIKDLAKVIVEHRAMWAGGQLS